MARKMENLMSRSVQQSYVFYQDLSSYNDGSIQRDLFDESTKEVKNLASLNIESNDSIFLNEISFLQNMLSKEIAKEKMLLSDIFGVTISNYNYNDKKIAQQIITAINEIFSTKEIFQRNIERILDTKHSQGKVLPTEFLTTQYLQPCLDANYEELIKTLEPLILAPKKNDKLIENLISKYIEKSLQQAVQKMLESSRFNLAKNKDDKEFSFLLNHLNGMSLSNPFMKQIYDLYKLDELKKAILDEINYSKSIKKYREVINKATKNTIKNAKSRKEVKGNLAEYITTYIAEILNKNKNMSAAVTGGAKAKPDAVFGFNVDISPIINSLESDGKVDRQSNLQKIQAGYDKINRIKSDANGYIVYSNAKSYILSDSFKDRGFSAGASGTIEYFSRVVSQVDNSVNTAQLLGTIINFAEGAVGENAKQIQQKVEEELSAAIALFLFDDFTIDDANKGIQSLHFLNLDGVYIPLSFLLTLLIKALQISEQQLKNKKVKELVKVTLEKHQIKYPNEEKWKTGMWTDQRNEALNWKLAEVHFLKNFQQIIAENLKIS